MNVITFSLYPQTKVGNILVSCLSYASTCVHNNSKTLFFSLKLGTHIYSDEERDPILSDLKLLIIKKLWPP